MKKENVKVLETIKAQEGIIAKIHSMIMELASEFEYILPDHKARLKSENSWIVKTIDMYAMALPTTRTKASILKKSLLEGFDNYEQFYIELQAYILALKAEMVLDVGTDEDQKHYIDDCNKIIDAFGF